MAKIFWQNLFCKTYDINYDKSYIVFVPANYLLVLWMLTNRVITYKISYVFSRKEAIVSLLLPVLLCWRYIIIIDS